jgi:TPR repeat protein
LIPVVVVLIALRLVTSFFYTARKGNLPKESGSASDLTATSGQPKLENAGPRHTVRNPVRGVQHVVAAKPGTAQTIDAAKEDDPVELWKAVRRGSVSAEVALANLYLEGEAVPQNCEQAHMLLYAASMKGSKAADNSLKSSYAERCE